MFLVLILGSDTLRKASHWMEPIRDRDWVGLEFTKVIRNRKDIFQPAFLNKGKGFQCRSEIEISESTSSA